MKYPIMVLALVGVLASPRPAAAITGNEMFKLCETRENSCYAFVIGWLGGFNITNKRYGGDYGQSPRVGICLPDKVSYRQYIDIFFNWLRDHPERRHSDAELILWSAFREAFPCR